MDYQKTPEKYSRPVIDKELKSLQKMNWSELERIEIKQYFDLTSDIAFRNYMKGNVKSLLLCTIFIDKCREVINQRKK